MEIQDLSQFSEEEIAGFISHSNANEITLSAPSLTPKQIAALLPIFDRFHQSDEKIYAIVSALKDKSQLEAVGNGIKHEQFLALLNQYAKNHKIDIEQISAILVGMSPETFANVLGNASSAELTIIQNLGKTEPLQHHLTLLSNALIKNDNDFSNDYAQIDLFVSEIDLNDISLEDLLKVMSKLKNLQIAYKILKDITEIGLKLAWRTDSTDLIDRYNTMRTHCIQADNLIGESGSEVHMPTGLFQKMALRLVNIFGNSEDPNDKEVLRDDDDALEALAKFSVWYLEDYYAIGLFPFMQSPAELDLNPDTHTTEQRNVYRNKLFADAKEFLHHIGLKTVKDVKANGIFSKRTLKEFIASKTALKKE